MSLYTLILALMIGYTPNSGQTENIEASKYGGTTVTQQTLKFELVVDRSNISIFVTQQGFEYNTTHLSGTISIVRRGRRSIYSLVSDGANGLTIYDVGIRPSDLVEAKISGYGDKLLTIRFNANGANRT